MEIYIPEGSRQKEQTIRFTVPEYIRWLTGKGDLIRILPIRRSSPQRVYYEPLIEVYADNKKVHFHCIGGSDEERRQLETWIAGFKPRKDGYIKIKRVSRKPAGSKAKATKRKA